ncbi:excalibur calcium-binding domain-containing protein [Bacillus sp. FJAT-49705]|uniref:Excalibur calcium-binding domain-containing protein n=1 Tax=Cytobacillus citreus TaxID=2833586 RepID=A0ABS5NWY4_9BACI|nr:excalibur calcium-binding domain-containing protein [Cytobacillus citreus]MBS4192343.1 excalibur calcium-binding domain-containing protein [Cytobacillus citreus]
MTAVFLIGFLLFLFSLIYILFHFLRKIKDRNRILSKKIFFSTFVGGLLLFIIGGTNMDTGVQNELNESLATIEKLSTENNDLHSEVKKLKSENEQFSKQNGKLSEEVKDLSTKVTAAESAEADKTNLSKQITELESKNKSLENEVNSLKDQLASKNTSTASSNTNESSTSTTSSGESEYFSNCTELRKVYPNGVSSDHPAYQSKMDRDKDNYACER